MGKKTSFDPTTGVISNLKYTKKPPGQSPSDRYDSFKVGTYEQGDKTTIFFTRTPEIPGKPLQFMFGPTERGVTINQMRSALKFHDVITKGDIEYTLSGDDALFNLIKNYLFPPPAPAAAAPVASLVASPVADDDIEDDDNEEEGYPAPTPAPAAPRELMVQILPTPEPLPDGWAKAYDDINEIHYRTTTIKDKQGKPIIIKGKPTKTANIMYPQYASFTPDEDSSAPASFTSDEDSSAAPAPPASENIRTLPEGWTEHIDDNTGNTYYYNSLTGDSTWYLPQ
jgi:hypothetical protein